MIHSSFLRRVLALVLSTLILFALLTLCVYQIISPQIFASNKLEELLPKGRTIVSYVEKAFTGELPASFVSLIIGTNTDQWDAIVWVVDNNGNTLIRTQQSEGRRIGSLPEELEPMLAEVLAGNECTHIGELSSFKAATSSKNRSSNTGSAIMQGLMHDTASQQESEDLTGSMVVLGLPLTYMDEPVGAVFMAQSMNEIVAGMNSLFNALLFSVTILSFMMLPVAFFFAYHMARPMRQMRNVALTMASGDFTIRAHESGIGEIAELGGALNYLSGALSHSISALTIERNRLRRILNGLSEGIIAVDQNGAVTHANPAVLNLFNCTSDKWNEDRNLLTTSPKLWALYDQVLNTNTGMVKDITVDGRIIRVTISSLEGEHKRPVGAVGILRDVTQSERLEQTRRDYVANVSHELRTPLTAMRALIEPLRDGLIRGEDQRQRTYDTILRETLRLSRLVNDMLELSRLQSGNFSLEKNVFNPLQLLRSVFDTYAQYADDVGQTLLLHVPDALPLIYGNPDRTQQVLVSILDNAMKYTPEGGTVELIAEPCAGYIRIIVKDTGPGIPPEDLPHVFERFYKADKAHQGKGTGLGLAIAREIMRLLDEKLDVTSELGHGTAFSFTLHTPDAPLSLYKNDKEL